MKSAARVAAVCTLLAASGCATISRAPFTEREQAAAIIPGVPGARFWADAPDAPRRLVPPIQRDGGDVTMLAISGGADEGAYAAGLMNGWTASGRRPEFSIVTGVSTGALIAPFAFLGPKRDADLATLFTTIDADDVYRARFPLAILGSVSAASTKPLRRLIARYATPALVDEIAREHRKGRRLFIGTANLDAQRTVVWDMGAIAVSDAPDRIKLFRRVLLASSAIPALFPPVVIRAESAGRPLTSSTSTAARPRSS